MSLKIAVTQKPSPAVALTCAIITKTITKG